MRGGGIIGLLGLAIVGVIIADALARPHGVKVAAGAANSGLSHTYDALLGHAP